MENQNHLQNEGFHQISHQEVWLEIPKRDQIILEMRKNNREK